MKYLILIAAMLGSSMAFAQADADGEGKSEFRLFKKSWSPTFYSLASYDREFEDEGAKISTYNYFSFHTFLSGPYRFSFRVPFTFATAGSDDFNKKSSGQEWLLQDTILEVRNPELLYLPADISTYWAFRIYLPVSHQSHLSGQIARFRNHFSFNKVLTSWLETTYENRYYYSWQSRNAYKMEPKTDELGFEMLDKSAATKSHQLQHWFHLLGRVNPKVKVGVTAISDDTFYNKSAENEKNKPPQRLLSAGPTVQFPINDSVKFIFIYQDEVDREKNLHELGQFQAKNTQYVLHSFVNF